MDNKLSAGGWTSRLADWFPDREFFMRSKGQVRFIKFSSRMQKITAAIVVSALAGWMISISAAAWTQYRAQADRSSLLEREAKVASGQERLEAYSNDIAEVTQDLVKRQEFLEAIAPNLPDDVQSGETVSDSATQAADTVSKVSQYIPAAAGLAQIEARQLVFVERLTRFADRRSARAIAAMHALGLNPKTIAGNHAAQAMGGPLHKLSTGTDGKIDPRFERLGLSIARMTALERGLDGIPQVLPAAKEGISSGFGYRRDPFNGSGAMHSGLDFRGPHGAPIYAAAKGQVTFSGWKHGYGKTVEIAHGNGMTTRYAHMARIVTSGTQHVAAGDVIGTIGSTGRSTGPHLHFEVRINNRAVNPRPFLERAPNVLKKARTSTSDRSANQNGE